jgi:hypothetical protein
MEAGGQPRNFAPHRIAMHRAAADRLVQHLGRLLERFARRGLVAAGRDSFRRVLGQRAGTCANDAVALGALETLPMTFLGRRMNGNMRHNQSLVTVRERGGNTDRPPIFFIHQPELKNSGLSNTVGLLDSWVVE